MAISTYSDLKTAVASFLHRDDLTSEIEDFIALAEADLQVRAKLSQWDTSATISLTSGAGALPGDFAKGISAVYGTQSGALQFLPGEQFDGVSANFGSGEPAFWTVRGSQVLVTPTATGDLALKYTARFTPLSGSATTNSILALFPDAYLNGALMHAAHWTLDSESMAKYAGMFEAAIKRIRTYLLDYKYPQGLQMRVA